MKLTRNCYIAVALLILLAYGAVAPLAHGAGGNAPYERARKLYYGTEGERYDRAKAVELLETARKSGSLEAQALLAHYYFYRESGDKESDYGEARLLAKEPAKKGLPIANFILGESLQLGHGITKDEASARKYYQKAFESFERDAAKGDSVAMNFLARCYAYETGVDKDSSYKIEWYKKAAAAGNSLSMNNLGLCYEHGNGVSEDMSQAFAWYSKSAELGNPEAMCNLGLCYEYGDGVEREPSRAVEWYRKSAEHGLARAAYCLGDCYYYGVGVEQDYNEAFKQFSQAAEHGDASGMVWVGVCYYDGRGVSQDRSKGVEWFEKAVETDPEANSGVQYLLGLSYRNGQGVPKDLDVALRWYKESAELGNEKAQEEYDSLKKIVESGGKLEPGEGAYDVESADFLEGLRGVMKMN